MKIVFFDDRAPKQPLRPEHKVERFADRRLADVVTADQESMPVEIHDAARDTSKVCDC